MISIKNLTKNFDDFTALDNVSCNIEKGVIYGVVGSNGAGKSTLLRLLSGIYKADGGIIEFDGENVWENPTVKENIVFVPDDIFYLNGSNLNRMAKLYASVYKNFDYSRFNFLVQTFKLDSKKSINTFSKGMKRQAAVILALSCHAQYMFFDETFDGLDPVMRALVKKLICDDVIENNVTAIMTSHSLRELEDTCDQLALLHKGGLVFESDISNLKTSLFKVQVAFSNDFTQADFGDLDILHYEKSGSVANMIVKGDKEITISELKKMNPLLLDILPLSLEEVFTYEMAMLGYSFDDVFLGGEESEK